MQLNHNRISGNALISLSAALRGQPCGVFMADVRLRVQAADACFYPDIVVTCDPRDLADGSALAVQHPWLVVEVLSDSAALYDTEWARFLLRAAALMEPRHPPEHGISRLG